MLTIVLGIAASLVVFAYLLIIGGMANGVISIDLGLWESALIVTMSLVSSVGSAILAAILFDVGSMVPNDMPQWIPIAAAIGDTTAGICLVVDLVRPDGLLSGRLLRSMAASLAALQIGVGVSWILMHYRPHG